jgi:DNA-binding MarR family transcriptional regulator
MADRDIDIDKSAGEGAPAAGAPAASAPATGVPVLDLASRLTQDHHQSLKLWLRMLSCTVRIENEIRSRLRTTFGITLPRFDLMAQLERHPEGLRMGELSKRMMVTGGNITGITDQLEQELLVARVPDPKDRRAYSVMLTPAGRQAFAEMAVVHEGWIAELLKDVSSEDKGTLIELLSEMKQRLNDSDERVP